MNPTIEAPRAPARPEPASEGACAVELVIPVYNEEADLEPSVLRLHEYLTARFPFSVQVTIADNASTDGTWALAEDLAARLPRVRAVHLDQKGRGRALREVWSRSDATVVAYMDVDLSTDLAALLPLVAPLLSGHSDLAIGSRLSRSSRVVRGARREVISRCYNLLLRAALRARFSDAQCGFKAVRTDCARELLPLVEDTGWFFDTELLVLAERAGLRIHEVPIDWVDDPDSRVDVVAIALEDLRGVLRIVRALATGALPLARLRAQLGRGPLVPAVPGVPTRLARQVVRFAAVGVASTLAYLVLFLLLRAPLGAQGANLTALLGTAVANTAANRRLTFGIRGLRHTARSQLEGVTVFGLGLAPVAPPSSRLLPAGCPGSSGAASTTRPGPAPHCSPCWQGPVADLLAGGGGPGGTGPGGGGAAGQITAWETAAASGTASRNRARAALPSIDAGFPPPGFPSILERRILLRQQGESRWVQGRSRSVRTASSSKREASPWQESPREAGDRSLPAAERPRSGAVAPAPGPEVCDGGVAAPGRRGSGPPERARQPPDRRADRRQDLAAGVHPARDGARDVDGRARLPGRGLREVVDAEHHRGHHRRGRQEGRCDDRRDHRAHGSRQPPHRGRRGRARRARAGRRVPHLVGR